MTDPVSLKTRQAIWERSGLVCEACGQDRAAHIHHRKLRSQGGTNDLENLLHLSFRCHQRIHDNWDGSSYPRGLLVKRGDIPALIPVVMYEPA